ncbi:actin depolymerizing protein [Rhodotorula sp. JG-1b]|nr:actin depolymerizing protein [Rhodotorula sp. JG-1b]
MPAQSGIEPSSETIQRWQEQLNDPQLRLVKWSIESEQVVPAGAWPSQSPTDDDAASDQVFKRDFDLFTQDGVVQDKIPAYFAFRLTPPPASTFAFVAWVPDHAPVRPKMLYASSTNSLVRALGDSRFPVRISAAEKNDLTYESYLSTITHDSADAPLTAREAEMAEIRAAEASTINDAEAHAATGRSIIFGPVADEDAEDESTTSPPADGSRREIKGALPWTDDVAETVRRLGGDESQVGSCAVLEIDVPNETVVLAAEQPEALAVPPSSPCYLLYRHAAGLVLVYSCPPSSPVKSRLLYSSAVLIFCKRAVPEWTGLSIIKKLETSDPAEITSEWIDLELGSLAASSAEQSAGLAAAESQGASANASGTSTPKPESEVKFARPARPGRRR